MTTNELIHALEYLAGHDKYRETKEAEVFANAAARLRDLEATTSKLPRTKDGAPVVLGVDSVWLHHPGVDRVVKCRTRTDDAIGSPGRCYPLVDDNFDGSYDWHYITDGDMPGEGSCLTKQVGMCYSTRELAEQSAPAPATGDSQ